MTFFVVLAIAASACAIAAPTGSPTTGVSTPVVVYVARLHPMNTKVAGYKTTGEARFTIRDDALAITGGRYRSLNGPDAREEWWLAMLGRLRPGWSLERATAQLAAIAPAALQETIPPQYDADVVKHARYYWLLLAESHLTRRLFGAMLRRIGSLPLPTG